MCEAKNYLTDSIGKAALQDHVLAISRCGGMVTEHPFDPFITHIVIPNGSALPVTKNYIYFSSPPLVVSEEWLIATLKEKKIQPLGKFPVNIAPSVVPVSTANEKQSNSTAIMGPNADDSNQTILVKGSTNKAVARTISNNTALNNGLNRSTSVLAPIPDGYTSSLSTAALHSSNSSLVNSKISEVYINKDKRGGFANKTIALIGYTNKVHLRTVVRRLINTGADIIWGNTVYNTSETQIHAFVANYQVGYQEAIKNLSPRAQQKLMSPLWLHLSIIDQYAYPFDFSPVFLASPNLEPGNAELNFKAKIVHLASFVRTPPPKLVSAFVLNPADVLALPEGDETALPREYTRQRHPSDRNFIAEVLRVLSLQNEVNFCVSSGNDGQSARQITHLICGVPSRCVPKIEAMKKMGGFSVSIGWLFKSYKIGAPACEDEFDVSNLSIGNHSLTDSNNVSRIRLAEVTNQIGISNNDRAANALESNFLSNYVITVSSSANKYATSSKIGKVRDIALFLKAKEYKYGSHGMNLYEISRLVYRSQAEEIYHSQQLDASSSQLKESKSVFLKNIASVKKLLDTIIRPVLPLEVISNAVATQIIHKWKCSMLENVSVTINTANGEKRERTEITKDYTQLHDFKSTLIIITEGELGTVAEVLDELASESSSFMSLLSTDQLGNSNQKKPRLLDNTLSSSFHFLDPMAVSLFLYIHDIVAREVDITDHYIFENIFTECVSQWFKVVTFVTPRWIVDCEKQRMFVPVADFLPRVLLKYHKPEETKAVLQPSTVERNVVKWQQPEQFAANVRIKETALLERIEKKTTTWNNIAEMLN